MVFGRSWKMTRVRSYCADLAVGRRGRFVQRRRSRARSCPGRSLRKCARPPPALAALMIFGNPTPRPISYVYSKSRVFYVFPIPTGAAVAARSECRGYENPIKKWEARFRAGRPARGPARSRGVNNFLADDERHFECAADAIHRHITTAQTTDGDFTRGGQGRRAAQFDHDRLASRDVACVLPRNRRDIGVPVTRRAVPRTPSGAPWERFCLSRYDNISIQIYILSVKRTINTPELRRNSNGERAVPGLKT
ncbi:hypothetical protein EVAR_88367_1 [Eumeta japonica]|uniref:Uncharacterized protein n=1 Tax=Eumeta variegata TaxID=151549 RepID=A0A4C1XA02_EUMVA|nr:hypothetical protein EVAR_88367_1 [Eumeta japonica]